MTKSLVDMQNSLGSIEGSAQAGHATSGIYHFQSELRLRRDHNQCGRFYELKY